MTIYIFVLKGNLNGENRSGAFLFLLGIYINPLYSGDSQMSTFANSGDPDKMQHNAAFHQGHTVLKVKKIFRQRIQHFLKYNLTPLYIYNGLFQVYCIKPEEESISIQRVKMYAIITFTKIS